jgi:hypothetical protein
MILDTLLFVSAEYINSWHARKGYWQHAFPLDVLTVHSSMFIIATDGECLTCGGFSLSVTISFGSLEFIADSFGSLSFSPKGSDSGAIFVGTTHYRLPSLHHMIEDSTDKSYTTSSEEESSDLPTSRRHSMGAPPAPIATTPWLEDALNTQTMMTVPPQTLPLR